MLSPFRRRFSILASGALPVFALATTAVGQGARSPESSSSLDLRQFENQSSWLNGINPDLKRNPEGVPGNTGRQTNKVMVDRKELQKLIDRRRNWIFHSYAEAGSSEFSMGRDGMDSSEDEDSTDVSLTQEDSRYQSSFARFVLDDWQRRAKAQTSKGEDADAEEESGSVFEPALGFSEDDSYAFGASTFLSRSLVGSRTGSGESVTDRWEQAAGNGGSLGAIDPRSVVEAESALLRGFEGAGSLAYLRRADRQRYLDTQAEFGQTHGFADIFGEAETSLFGASPLGDTGLPSLTSAAAVDIESEVNPTRETLNPILPGAGATGPLASGPSLNAPGANRPLGAGILGVTPGIGNSARPTRPLAPTGPTPTGRPRTRTILQMPNNGL